MSYSQARKTLLSAPRTWLVTGVAGFIGSNLLEQLLDLNQTVVGLDNLSTGYRENLEDVRSSVGEEKWRRFTFYHADILDLPSCLEAMSGVDIVLHQAALGSVPRSIEDPIATNAANVTGFLNMLVAACTCKVRRFVYAASSSTYGDHPGLPKVEEHIGKPLSPYAVTKYVNELYADVFFKTYGLESIGLRYFNVFGRRQDPKGAYAAVIPLWFGNLLDAKPCYINGDGKTSRDFCYIDNTIQANILAALTENPDAINQVYNVALGGRITLNQLHSQMRELIDSSDRQTASVDPIYREFRNGDVKHSQADISKACRLLGYNPTHGVLEGLQETAQWFCDKKNLQLDGLQSSIGLG